jgi:DNA-directed RNA polymerase III subunit RPC6
MSDDIDDADVAFKPKSSMGISSNPFFSADGRQTLIDLSDQAVVYRALRRLAIPLGQNQAPCGSCPQFNFCEQDGPVNPSGCQYITDWLAGTAGGWTADVKAERAKKAAEEEKERRRAAAAEAGEEYVEDEETNGGLELEEDELDEGDYKEGDMDW